MRGAGVGLSIVMGGGRGEGLGGWRGILCRRGIGIGMGMSIRRLIGMMLFMGRILDEVEVGGGGWRLGGVSLFLDDSLLLTSMRLDG